MDDWFGLQRGLVAVGLLAVVPGCPADGKDTATDGNSTDPGSTGATDGTGTGTGTTGTTGDPPTGTGSGSATDSGTGTTGEPTTGGTSTTDATTSSTSTTGGIDIPPVCQSYGAKYAECYMDPEGAMLAAQSCAYGIQEFAMPYGPDCVKANEDFYACLSALSCEEFTGPGPWCEAEATKIQLDCQ